jgi:hypothetical protein
MHERLLTVMIPSTPHRFGTTLPRLIETLDAQCREDVRADFVCIIDPEVISIGEKLNIMVRLAGKYVSCVADDDMVTDDYIATLLDAIQKNPAADVILYDTDYYIADKDGNFKDEPDYIIREGKGYGDRQEDTILYREPSDKMCWRTRFRVETPCVPTWETSDQVFASEATAKIKKEVRIERSLYKFYYSPYNDKGKRYRESLDRTRGGERWNAAKQ